MWYQSDRGGYIKLPVMTGKSKIKLIYGEKAENLMLYPMQKWDYAEPLLELLVEIKHLLESESCKFLIIVGTLFWMITSFGSSGMPLGKIKNFTAYW